MNTEIFEKLNEARNAFKSAEEFYIEQREKTREELVKLLPDKGEGLTAQELSEMTGLDTTTITSLLSHYRYHWTTISDIYVHLKKDGTIDHDKKIVKKQDVRTYRKY